MNPACGPNGGPMMHPAQLNEAQNNARRNRTYPEHVGISIGEAVAQRIAYRVAEGMEYAFWGGVSQMKGVYHWAWPTRPEHVRKAAMFTRLEIDGFINRKATDDGAQFILLQAHRLTDKVRQGLIRDGYTVENTDNKGHSAVRISWEPSNNNTKQE